MSKLIITFNPKKNWIYHWFYKSMNNKHKKTTKEIMGEMKTEDNTGILEKYK